MYSTAATPWRSRQTSEIKGHTRPPHSEPFHKNRDRSGERPNTCLAGTQEAQTCRHHSYNTPLEAPLTIPVCACGAPKTESPLAGIWRCEHCDGHCVHRGSCPRCHQYNTATNKRVVSGS